MRMRSSVRGVKRQLTGVKPDDHPGQGKGTYRKGYCQILDLRGNLPRRTLKARMRQALARRLGG